MWYKKQLTFFLSEQHTSFCIVTYFLQIFEKRDSHPDQHFELGGQLLRRTVRARQIFAQATFIRLTLGRRVRSFGAPHQRFELRFAFLNLVTQIGQTPFLSGGTKSWSIQLFRVTHMSTLFSAFRECFLIFPSSYEGIIIRKKYCARNRNYLRTILNIKLFGRKYLF